MSITPGTGGHGPREPGEPGEVFVRRPVLGNVRPPERDHLEPVSVGVLQELHVNPSAPDQRVVAAGERQPAGDEADVGAERQLVSARPAQNEGVGAGPPLLARLTGPVWVKQQQHKGDVAHRDPPQLLHERPQAPLQPHRCHMDGGLITS